MPAPGAHGFLWAIQDQQASGQLQSSRQEDHRALLSTSSLPSTASLPFTHHHQRVCITLPCRLQSSSARPMPWYDPGDLELLGLVSCGMVPWASSIWGTVTWVGNWGGWEETGQGLEAKVAGGGGQTMATVPVTGPPGNCDTSCF